MSIKDMKTYMNLCLEGQTSIPRRKDMLEETRVSLQEKMKEIQEAMEFINQKQQFFDEIMEGKREYTSNLIEIDACDHL